MKYARILNVLVVNDAMIKSVLTLVFVMVLMITGTGCHKEDGRKVEPEVALSVGNKLIIGEWKHQQTQLTAYDATTGAAKSTQYYDLPQINSVEFTADGVYLLNRTNSGTYGINTAGTLLTIKDAYGKTSTSDVKTLTEQQLIMSTTEVSENTRLVLVLSFIK